MPLFNDIDLGPSNPFKKPASGQQIGEVPIPGGYAVPYSMGGSHPSWIVTFMFQAQSAVGQFAAGSQKAVEYLGRQLEELARNPDLQPCYVQLFAGTNLPVASWVQPQDGWYLISHCEIDYVNSLAGVATANLVLEYVNPGPPRRIGVYTAGGALSSTYASAATNWVAFPLNATVDGLAVNRTGADGTIKLYAPPSVNPQPFALSATISDWFKGGCRVYDAMAAIGTNNVPAPPTVLNTNWVEVKGPDHRFVGDLVVTNGLQLLVVSPGIASQIATCWLWNTALGTPGWQQYATLTYQDNAANNGVVRTFSVTRVGLEEAVIQVASATAGTNFSIHTLRLQRGAYAVRAEFRPQSQANTNVNGLFLAPAASFSVAYNSGNATQSIAFASLPVTADAGFAAGYTTNSANPYLLGLLWQNPPGLQQPQVAAPAMGFGENALPAQNATGLYGFFAVPFATPQNLQAEAEGGAFTGAGGWTSQANGAASAGNEAKLASGSLTGAINTFGTAWQPVAGSTVKAWFRLKVTSAASGVSQFKYGIWNATDSVYIQSATVAPSALTTGYLLYSPGAAFVPTSGKNIQFRCESTATMATDVFVDEAFLAPTFGSPASSGPGDLWSQFRSDRTTILKRS